MIRNIILDVGGVLIDWTPEETMRAVGCTPEDIALIRTRIFDTDLWAEEDRSVLSREELTELFCSRVPEIADKFRVYYEHAADSVKLRPFVHDWLDAMHRAGYRVYILSNFGRQAWHKAIDMGAIDFLDRTDGQIVSFMVGKVKPEPGIYSELLTRFSLRAEECVFLDDAEKNIRAARELGFSVIHFTGYDDAVQKLAALGVSLQ